MNRQQKSNLAKTAIKLLQDKTIKFDMSWFMRDSDGDRIYLNNAIKIARKPECGTSCCFAGYGPIALLNGSKYSNWINYMEGSYSANDTGSKKQSLRYNFLFCEKWPDDRKQAAARAIKILENGGNLPKGALKGDYTEDSISSGGVIIDAYHLVDYDKRYLTKLTIDQLIKRLEPFVYNRKKK